MPICQRLWMHREIVEVLATAGFISRRTHCHLISAIDRAVANREIVPIFPGTYAAERSETTLTAALFDWDPNAVLIGASAARATWWPELDQSVVTAATSRRLRRDVKGVALTTGQLHPDLTRRYRDWAVQVPAASALELARDMGPGAIDEAFRRGKVKVRELERALTLMPWRKGNAALWTYVRDSRDEPWSTFERDAHAILRSAGITGWKTNYCIELYGDFVYLDIAFPGPKLDIELDGWRYHGDRASFSRDRRRDVLLQQAGWTPLRFTVDTLPMMLPTVKRFLEEKRH